MVVHDAAVSGNGGGPDDRRGPTVRVVSGLPAVLAAVGVLLVAACGPDRPGAATWAGEWEAERAIVPTVDEFLVGGRPLCDSLVGQLRVSAGELTPTPAEALDDAVEAWVDHAESIAFECDLDRGALAERLRELEVLAVEIDAGLAAESD